MDKHYFESSNWSTEDFLKSDELKNFPPVYDNVTKVIGTNIDTIKIVENFMPKHDVDILMNRLNIMYEIVAADNNTFKQIENESKTLTLKYKEKIKINAEKFFNLKLEYDNYASPAHSPDSYFSGRKKNMATGIHTDNLDIDKHKYDKYNWSGHISNLIYLNDDYEGGELFFPHHNFKIKPKPGMLVSFPGNWWNRHAIFPASNMRFAMSIFLKIKDFE
jgi:hypothetical protein